MAPAAALPNISAAAGRCRTPKSTAKATAPTAAARVNSHVGAGGASAILLIACMPLAAASRLAHNSSTVRKVEATRSMSTPEGAASIAEVNLPFTSSVCTSSSPQCGNIAVRNPKHLLSRLAAPKVWSVDSPLMYKTRATARIRFEHSSRVRLAPDNCRSTIVGVIHPPENTVGVGAELNNKSAPAESMSMVEETGPRQRRQARLRRGGPFSSDRQRYQIQLPSRSRALALRP